jgi:hypothetical protein
MTSCEPNTIIEIEIGISGLLLIWRASIVAEASRAASTIWTLQRPSMRDPIARRTGALLPSPLVGEGAFAKQVKLPQADPVIGMLGPLIRLWKRA